jgi:hypothetical protein
MNLTDIKKQRAVGAALQKKEIRKMHIINNST